MIEEIKLIKRINQSSLVKKINESYFKLTDTFHEVISNVKGIKSMIKDQKELVVTTIEQVKESIPIKHIIAQKDVVFSNSMVEFLNKVIKHQFLLYRIMTSRKQLTKALEEAITTYNNIRPQMNLGGNTSSETFTGRYMFKSIYRYP